MLTLPEHIEGLVSLQRADASIRCCGLQLSADGVVLERKVYRASEGRFRCIGTARVDDLILKKRLSVYEYESITSLDLKAAKKINFHFRDSLGFLDDVDEMMPEMPFVNKGELSATRDTLSDLGDIRCASLGIERSLTGIEKVTFYFFPVERTGGFDRRCTTSDSVAKQFLEGKNLYVPRFLCDDNRSTRIFSLTFTSFGFWRYKIYCLFDCARFNSLVRGARLSDQILRDVGAAPILLSFPVDDRRTTGCTMYFTPLSSS